MGDALQALFGGSKQTQKSGPVDMTPPEIEALRGDWASTIQGLLSKGGTPAYQGPFVAQQTDAEKAALNAAANTAYDPARKDLLSNTLQGKFLPGQQGANPFLDQAISAAQNPTMRNLTETLDRALPGRFTSAGQFIDKKGSSPFDRAAAMASTGAADAMSKIATDMSFAGYEAERGRQQQAATIQQQDVDTLIKNAQAQGLPRLIEDVGIERALQEFQSRSTALLQILQAATQASGLTQLATQAEGSATSQKGIVPALVGTSIGALGGLGTVGPR